VVEIANDPFELFDFWSRSRDQEQYLMGKSQDFIVNNHSVPFYVQIFALVVQNFIFLYSFPPPLGWALFNDHILWGMRQAFNNDYVTNGRISGTQRRQEGLRNGQSTIDKF
jgi:hypothetical protein